MSPAFLLLSFTVPGSNQDGIHLVVMSPSFQSVIVSLCLSWPWDFWSVLVSYSECPSVWFVWYFLVLFEIILRLRLCITGENTIEVMSFSVSYWGTWNRYVLLLMVLSLIMRLRWYLPGFSTVWLLFITIFTFVIYNFLRGDWERDNLRLRKYFVSS